MKFLEVFKIIGLLAAMFFCFGFLHGCAIQHACKHEKPGTMIVFGGNSYRCQ